MKLHVEVTKMKDDKYNGVKCLSNGHISRMLFLIGAIFAYIVLRKRCCDTSTTNGILSDGYSTRDTIKTRNMQTVRTDCTRNDMSGRRRINRIEDIKDVRKKRMGDAVRYSDKISLYIRYLAITGLGLIWLLVEKNEYKLDALLHNLYAQIMIILCLLTLILELVHLIMNVIVNLLYANSRLRKPLSYVAKPRKTQYVATKFPKIIVKIEWTIWFVKIICLMIALLVFVCCLLYKMFG